MQNTAGESYARQKKTVIAALRVNLSQFFDSAALLNSRDNQSSHVVVAVLPRLG